jgi:hypothetical protein
MSDETAKSECDTFFGNMDSQTVQKLDRVTSRLLDVLENFNDYMLVKTEQPHNKKSIQKALAETKSEFKNVRKECDL